MPMTQTDLHHATPIYEQLPGWFEDISTCRTFDELPAAAQSYVHRLEELSGARISVIGVGPGREQTIVRRIVGIILSATELDFHPSPIDAFP